MHGFQPENENFDFGKKLFHRKGDQNGANFIFIYSTFLLPLALMALTVKVGGVLFSLELWDKLGLLSQQRPPVYLVKEAVLLDPVDPAHGRGAEPGAGVVAEELLHDALGLLWNVVLILLWPVDLQIGWRGGRGEGGEGGREIGRVKVATSAGIYIQAIYTCTQAFDSGKVITCTS